jgi:predicted nucleic acid-binding protein
MRGGRIVRWASAVDRRQSFHGRSGKLVKQAHSAGQTIITTNYVLAELTSLLTRPLRIPRLLQALTTDHHFEQAGFIRLPK